MIYKATNLITKEMDEVGIRYTVHENEDSSRIYARFSINNGPGLTVQFISRDDDNDVSIRLFRLIGDVSKEKKGKICSVVNECNRKYRFLKFTFDEENDVNIEYDLTAASSDDSIGLQACELFMRIMDIANEVYPLFMQAMWS